MPASASLLSVRDLTITHSGAADPSPQCVSIDVTVGEFLLLLGPSGSGKSTLTLALNGLIPQSIPAQVTGTVHVIGRSPSQTPTSNLATDIAMVFQDPDSQLVTGTLFDEVAFALENLCLPIEEIHQRVESALRDVGLWRRRGENPDRLSGGGRQRLAIASALATRAELIVLDEPTANLDVQGVEDVYSALGGLMEDSSGRSIILVEHNLDAAMRFATRVCVLNQAGEPVFDGDPQAIIEKHTDELVDMGVWLPDATLAALELRRRGQVIEPLPLTPEALTEALAGQNLSVPDEGGPASSAAAPEQVPCADPVIRTHGLRVRHGRTEILHGIDLEIRRGAFTAIIGPNGAGKTTLIQALAGVVRPPKSQVWIGDLDVGRASPRGITAKVGFVFQNPEHQFISDTVFDELAQGLRIRKVEESAVEARTTEVMERFGLGRKRDVHPFLLSGGEKRRLSVGTALITRPEVLVLDEPTFGQDRSRATELIQLLTGLRDEGTSIVIVTHDLQLVASHSEHTIVVADGRVLAHAPTAQVCADHELFVAAGLRLPPLFRELPPHLHNVLKAGHGGAS